MRIIRTLSTAALTALLSTLAFTTPAIVEGQRVPVPVTGRTLDLQLTSGEEAKGELIQAGERELLLWGEGGLQSFSLDDITAVRYERHGFGSDDALLWVALGALVTGGGMTIACAQVDDTSCGGVFPVFALLWAAIGGGFAGHVASGQMQDLELSPDALAPYARFPQGAPDGFGKRAPGTPRAPR